MTKVTIDHSKRTCATTCLRKYYYQHIRNLAPSIGSSALRYGSTWHGFMDGYYRHIKENGWTRDGEALNAAVEAGQKAWEEESVKFQFYTDYRTLQNCAKAFLEYVNYFSGDFGMLEVIEVEKAFKIEFPDFIFTGKLDLQVELNGLPWLMEHKTTGQYLQRQIQLLNRSAQIIGYSHACQLAGYEIEGVLISFHHLSSRKLKSGDWGALKIDFQRVPHIHSTQNVHDWYEIFKHEANRIAAAHETGNWVKQYDSCYNYGQCPYLPLCDQNRPLGEEVTSEYVSNEWDVLKSVDGEPICLTHEM